MFKRMVKKLSKNRATASVKGNHALAAQRGKLDDPAVRCISGGGKTYPFCVAP